MQIDHPEVDYDEDQIWSTKDINIDDVISDYNKDTRRFTSFLWGCFVTAYARRNLWSAILHLGGDYWYSDTDSVKVSHHERYADYFTNYNNWIDKKLQTALAYHQLPIEYIHPKTIKGEEKPLGHWDYEGTYCRYKDLGAKRYLYTTLDKGIETLHITCAGVAKANACDYLMYIHNGDMEKIFDSFADGLRFPGLYEKEGKMVSGTGKSTHLYNDMEYDAELTDYLGNTAEVHELSSINLSPADYNLGIAGAFFDFLRQYWQGVIVTKDNL